MKVFLEWLKEECLPGIWSKGVQTSRSSKSIERIPGNARSRELRFKMITSERILAYEITLWPEDQDAHCNCGSKVEPCHHIVGAALAHSGGQIPEPDTRIDSTLPRLHYCWIYLPGDAGALPKMRLKRRIKTGDTETELPASLIAWTGGVQSGRLRGPLPAITSEDLKLDEIYSRSEPSWNDLLRILSSFPALPVEGHPRLKELRVRNPKNTPGLRIRSKGRDSWVLESLEGSPEETLSGGLRITDGEIGISSRLADGLPRLLTRAELPNFVLNELPALKESIDVRVEASDWPPVFELEPDLKLKIHDLKDGTFSLTATLDSGPTPPGAILKPNPAREAALAKEAREKFHLSLNDPKTFPASRILAFRAEAPERFLGSGLDPILSAHFETAGGIPLETALREKDLLIRLLQKRETGALRNHAFRSLASRLEPGDPNAPPPGFEFKIPPGIEARPYQLDGIRWLKNSWSTLGGALLADDMGLGKTFQTLAILEGPSLVVAPATLLQNWAGESLKFRPDLKISIYHGPGRVLDPEADLTLTTYSLLASDAEEISKIHWRVAVLDEAHIIRNPDTRAAIASSGLLADFRLALTGTPVQNRLRDLVSLFQFISPGLIEDESDANPKLTTPYLLRRTKESVLPELPPKTRIEHPVELGAEESEFYQLMLNAAKKDLFARLAPGEELEPLVVFEALLRARQACSHRALIDPGARGSSSKLDAILELTGELIEAGQSVLIYSQWTGFLDLLETKIRGLHPCFRLDGSTRDRGGEVQAFQDSGKPSVFLLSLHAGGVGLNLTRASHVLFSEPWWNPFVELQAEDRAYRMGQEKPVTIHRFLATGTIEESIRALQLKKAELGDSILSTPELLQLI